MHIAELNEQTVELTVKLKALEGDSVHQKERLVRELGRERMELREKVYELQKEVMGLRQREGSSTGRDADGRNEEIAAIKGELASSLTLISTLKHDLSSLTALTTDLTHQNALLNHTIVHLNLALETKETLLSTHSDHSSSALHAEKLISDMKENQDKLEKQILEMTEKMIFLGDLENLCKKLNSEFRTFESNLPTEFAPQIANFKSILSRFQPENINKISEIAALNLKIRQMEVEIRASNRELERGSVKEKRLMSRISDMEELHSVTKKNLLQTIDRQNEIIAKFEEKLREIEEKYEKTCERLQKSETELNICNTKIGNLQKDLNSAQVKLSESQKSESKALISIKSLQMQLTSFNLTKNSAEAALELRENKVKNDILRVKSLAELLWKRDNLVLKKTAEVIKLQDKVKMMEIMLFNAQMKGKIDDLKTERSKKTVINRTGNGLKMRIRGKNSKSMILSKVNNVKNDDLQCNFAVLISKVVDLMSKYSSEIQLQEGEKVGLEMQRVIREIETLVGEMEEEVPASWLPVSLKTAICPQSDSISAVFLVNYIKSLPGKLARFSSHSTHSVS